MPPNDRAVLNMWVVYDHPKDYPNGFVTRRWEIRPGEPEATPDAIYTSSLERARALIPPGLHRMERNPEDDPVIVEVWL